MKHVKGAWKRGDTYTVRVPTRAGGAVARTTGSSDPHVVRKMIRMLEDLGPRGRRSWDLLDAVANGRLTLGALYDAHAANALDGLGKALTDVDLVPYLDSWEAWVRAELGDTGTAETYRRQVGTLTGVRFQRAELTPLRITQWLTDLAVSPGTRRKYCWALSSFCGYLRSVGVITENPIDAISVPKNNPPRMRYESLENIKRLLLAQPEPFRTLSAFIHATAAEVSAALAVKRRDVDLGRRRAHIPGTKTHTRDRHEVVISEWALPYVEAHCQTLLPNALLFDGIDRFKALAEHKKACRAIGVEDYTLHDARHSWAVRAIRFGATFEVVRLQLGHKDTSQVASVYGRFLPTEEERTSWERNAAFQEQSATAPATSAAFA